MKTYGLILAATILLLQLDSAAVPQQSTPPPSSANSSPSLAVTMQFIQDKLNGMGILRYTSYHTDPGYPPGPANAWSYSRSALTTTVVATPSTCTISYHEKEDFKLVPNETTPTSNLVAAEADYSIPLKDVQDLKVETMEQYITADMAQAGNSAIATSTQPKTLMLIVQRSNGSPNHVAFQDAALADRVAKALVHAVALCGGGNKDPF